LRPVAPRAIFEFDRGRLLFMDVRRFGTIRHGASALKPDGVEPLSEELSDGRFFKLLSGSRQEIKQWLLRQDKVTGIGNIYACEALYRARINPLQPAGTLSPALAQRLLDSIRAVLTSAIDNAGTTFSDFRHADGARGGYQNHLAVYGRDGHECPACRRPVSRIVQGQRSTFFCDGCQPLQTSQRQKKALPAPRRKRR
jgi:formamidopyrimidine-DNA glycosylase